MDGPITIIWLILIITFCIGAIILQIYKQYYKSFLITICITVLLLISPTQDIMHGNIVAMTNCLYINNFTSIGCRLTVFGIWSFHIMILIIFYTGLDIIPMITNECFTNRYVSKENYRKNKHNNICKKIWFGCILAGFLLGEFILKRFIFITQLIGVLHIISWASFYNLQYVQNISLNLYWIWTIPLYIAILYIQYKKHTSWEWYYCNLFMLVLNYIIFIITWSNNKVDDFLIWGYYYLLIVWIIQYIVSLYSISITEEDIVDNKLSIKHWNINNNNPIREFIQTTSLSSPNNNTTAKQQILSSTDEHSLSSTQYDTNDPIYKIDTLENEENHNTLDINNNNTLDDEEKEISKSQTFQQNDKKSEYYDEEEENMLRTNPITNNNNMP